jgi:predicted transcriptional regulator
MTPAELQSRVSALEDEIASLKEKLEYAQTIAGINRGLDEADRGLGIPLREADQQLRAKYNIPR